LAIWHKLSNSNSNALEVPRTLAVWQLRPSRRQAQKMHCTQPPKFPSADRRMTVRPQTSAPIVSTDGAAHLSALTMPIALLLCSCQAKLPPCTRRVSAAVLIAVKMFPEQYWMLFIAPLLFNSVIQYHLEDSAPVLCVYNLYSAVYAAHLDC